MGLWGKLKKGVKKVVGSVEKGVKGGVRGVENFAHTMTGKAPIGEHEEAFDETGLRGTAAKRLMNKTQQAGSGQISFNTMEEDQT